MSDLVRGERITSVDGRTRRGTAGRVCVDEGCVTRLSVYNPGKHCSIHAPMEVPRTRGRKNVAS